MKKELYVIITTLVVGIAIFIAGFMFFKRGSEASRTDAAAAPTVDQSRLVRDWSPTLGPAMARVVVVEFLDPECESCRAMHPYVKRILSDYDGQLRYVVRYMPFHPNSMLAASWLQAAEEQGKYWEALNALFENQPAWGAHHAPKPELIPVFLKAVGVDVAMAKAALSNPVFKDRIEQDKADGLSLGVNGTPTFFVNGKMLSELGDGSLRRLIDQTLNEKAR